MKYLDKKILHTNHAAEDLWRWHGINIPQVEFCSGDIVIHQEHGIGQLQFEANTPYLGFVAVLDDPKTGKRICRLNCLNEIRHADPRDIVKWRNERT